MQYPLKEVTIIDLSYRLPGPLATHILQQLGATIIKIENINLQDPFKECLSKTSDLAFSSWYEELNKNKRIELLDFNSFADQKKIQTLIQNSDACLLGVSKHIQSQLGMTKNFFKSLTSPYVFLELKSSQENNQPLHDLNALAEIGLLDLYLSDKKNENIIPPPFLPLGGITFGQKIATDLLAALLQAQKKKEVIHSSSDLMTSLRTSLSPFWSKKLQKTKQTQFLHNGLYPCYAIYKTKDNHYVALAAIEKKFWIRFCQLFELPFSAEDRFKTDQNHIFLALSLLFTSKNSNEIKDLTQNESICLSLF